MLVVEDEFAPVNNATTFKEVLLEADKAVKVCVSEVGGQCLSIESACVLSESIRTLMSFAMKAAIPL